jgi:hypothetical protein
MIADSGAVRIIFQRGDLPARTLIDSEPIPFNSKGDIELEVYFVYLWKALKDKVPGEFDRYVPRVRVRKTIQHGSAGT